MRSLTIVATILCAICDTTVPQSKYGATSAVIVRASGSDSSPVLILENGLSPYAVLSGKKETFCVATNWIDHYPLIAERVDSTGLLHWKTAQISNPQNSLDQDGKGIILPRLDGGAYFIFEFWEFRGRSGDAKLYAGYPHIQLVDAAGNIQWGVDGRRLTNLVVGILGGASVCLVHFAPDGDLMVYWKWFDEDSSGAKTFATYVQKVDHSTGDLKYGPNGKKILDFRARQIARSAIGNIYVLQDPYVSQNGGDSVACFNSWAEKQWQYPLLSGINADKSVIAGANDAGQLAILYETGQDVRARLYDAQGLSLWRDKVIITDPNRVYAGARILSWKNTRWVFATGPSVSCFDSAGSCCWIDQSRTLSGTVFDIAPVDESHLIVAFRGGTDLKVQKINASGEFLWEPEGIPISEMPSGYCTILPDSEGGAFLIFDALTEYEPIFRPRGTYFQRVNKEGRAGIITDVVDRDVYQKPYLNAYASCYPNPFATTTTIRIVIQGQMAAGYFHLVLFDLLGREVRKYSIENPAKGIITVPWDGRDTRGAEIGPGVYFYHVRTKDNNVILSGKLLRVR